ncbi:MAG: NUDIX hydrolase [Firmicutes bacterium]|nr:NUDIX hydrolase [Bacillota bacterium]
MVIRQWRWAVGEPLWEIPAGKIDAGEAALTAAVRELQEETGFLAGDCRPVLSMYPSPGYTTERIDLFYARDLRAGAPQPDEEEEIGVELWDEDRIRRALAAGEVRNAVTLLGLYWWLDQMRG